MQEMLIELNYDLGKYGADGDFGDCTELAVKAFQRDASLEVTGKADDVTLAMMEGMLEIPPRTTGRAVKIVGGDCYIRTAPNTEGKAMGVARRGSELPYGGVTSEGGWNQVAFEGQICWVSGKYSEVVG